MTRGGTSDGSLDLFLGAVFLEAGAVRSDFCIYDICVKTKYENRFKEHNPIMVEVAQQKK